MQDSQLADEIEKTLSAGHRYFDSSIQATIVKISQGDCYITGDNSEVIATVLGSCVAACIRDPLLKIGGMNHFMLPKAMDEAKSTNWGGSFSAAARYGNFAMESLINGLLSKGGRRDRLEVKVFGGGNVMRTSRQIGCDNADFVEEYLKTEGFKIASKSLRGDLPRMVRYFPDSGKVMVRELPNTMIGTIAKREQKQRIRTGHVDELGTVELFD